MKTGSSRHSTPSFAQRTARALALPRVALLSVLAGAALAACGADDSRNRGNRNEPGDPVDMAIAEDVDLAGADLSTYIDPGKLPPDDTCSEETFAPQKVGDPDIIVVLDRSGSMGESPQGGGGSKWDQTETALKNVVTQLEQQGAPIHFGLILFPSDNDCGVSVSLPVPVGPMKGADVVSAIAASSPDGNTPAAKAIEVGTAYYDQLKDGRSHVFLLATDGEPNCDSGFPPLPMICQSDANCPAGWKCGGLPPLFGICEDPTGGGAGKAIAAALAKGMKTYVVGISFSGTSSALNQMATAGGTARPGNTKYYPVNQQADLEMALKNITAQVISCSFALKSLPMANQKIVVTIGGVEIDRDMTHAKGWDLETMTKTVTFYGDTCTQLQTNPGKVSIGYTCPPPG